MEMSNIVVCIYQAPSADKKPFNIDMSSLLNDPTKCIVPIFIPGDEILT